MSTELGTNTVKRLLAEFTAACEAAGLEFER